MSGSHVSSSRPFREFNLLQLRRGAQSSSTDDLAQGWLRTSFRLLYADPPGVHCSADRLNYISSNDHVCPKRTAEGIRRLIELRCRPDFQGAEWGSLIAQEMNEGDTKLVASILGPRPMSRAQIRIRIRVDHPSVTRKSGKIHNRSSSIRHYRDLPCPFQLRG